MVGGKPKEAIALPGGDGKAEFLAVSRNGKILTMAGLLRHVLHDIETYSYRLTL